MSSEEQLNVHVSAVVDDDSKQNDSQYHEKCSVENNANITEESVAVTNDRNGQNLVKIGESHDEENENVPSVEDVVSQTGTVESSHEKFPFTDNDNVVADQNVACNSGNGQDQASSVLTGKALTIPVNEDKLHTVDSNETILTRSVENEEAQSCAQQENNESTENPVVESNDQPVECMNETNVDDDEFEQNDNDDDASNDGNDNSSNEHDSNEDCSDVEQYSDGTTEVENDEYILDTVLRKPRKERRRIVSVIDDSDPEMDVERERLLESPTMEENRLTDTVEEEEKDIVHLIQNEKPGPKSKKISTQKLKELQARELLRNAVVIPSSSKKKKSRIIDSDDDDEGPVPICVDVDDIGLPDTTADHENENDSDTLMGSSILLNDVNDVNDFDKPDAPSMGNSIQNPDGNNVDEINVKSEPKDDNIPVVSQCPTDIDSSRETENQSSEVGLPLKEEPIDTTENETGALCDSGNSTDSTNQQNRTEVEIDSVNTDLLPFSASSSSETEDEFIPNEIYFGTPDHNRKRSSRGKAQRTRGRQTKTSTRDVKTVPIAARSAKKGGGGGGRPPGRDNFIDNRRISSTSSSVSGTSSSNSDDEYQKSKARRKPATVTIVKHPTQLYHKASLPVRPIQRQHQLQQIQRQNDRKGDRFYDKSRDIPNSVYFGDVDVPLHVLHAYGDSDSDNNERDTKVGAAKCDTLNKFLSQASRGRPTALPKQTGQLHRGSRNQPTKKQFSNSQNARARPKAKGDSSLSPSNDQSIQMMKKCLKAAGLKNVKLNRLWEGCKSNSERADKMLELLREKGLEGEPTIAKCKQLRVECLTRREIEDLDPNLIIQTEGRTRRSTRAATRRQYTYDEEEILETRTKLRKVIDSDSDFE